MAEPAALLQRKNDKQEAFEAIRVLVDRRTAGLRVDVHGGTAAILRLAQAGKDPAATSRTGLEQLVMVAGVGFEPTTFRL